MGKLRHVISLIFYFLVVAYIPNPGLPLDLKTWKSLEFDNLGIKNLKFLKGIGNLNKNLESLICSVVKFDLTSKSFL